MIFAELLMGLAAVAELVVVMLATALELALVIVSLLIEVVARVIRPTSAGDTATQAPKRPSLLVVIDRKKWFRRLGVVACSCLVLTILLAVILNLFFFEGTVRWLLRQGEARSGTHVEFESATGNLFAGRMELRNASLKRDQHPTTTFDLRAAGVKIDLDLLSMIFGPRTVEAARFEGLRGQASRVGKPESSPWFSGRRLLIRQLEIQDAQVTWTDHTRKRVVPIDLAVDELASQDLRSRWLALDLLFKTNGSGRIDGGAFTVARKPHGDGQETTWHFTKLPVAAAANYVGGPFTLLDQGEIEVDAKTVWGGSAARSLDMNWSFVFRDVHASLPEGDGWRTTVALPMVAFINQNSRDLPLNFRLKYDEGRFDGAASIEAAGLWEAVADGATEALAGKLGIARDRVEDARDLAVDRFRSLLPSSRKADETP